MKIKITFKDPDALHDCIETSLDETDYGNLSQAEVEAVRAIRHQEIRDLCATWFEYGEYLTVEVDTETETCTVVPN